MSGSRYCGRVPSTILYISTHQRLHEADQSRCTDSPQVSHPAVEYTLCPTLLRHLHRATPHNTTRNEQNLESQQQHNTTQQRQHNQHNSMYPPSTLKRRAPLRRVNDTTMSHEPPPQAFVDTAVPPSTWRVMPTKETTSDANHVLW